MQKLVTVSILCFVSFCFTGCAGEPLDDVSGDTNSTDIAPSQSLDQPTDNSNDSAAPNQTTDDTNGTDDENGPTDQNPAPNPDEAAKVGNEQKQANNQKPSKPTSDPNELVEITFDDIELPMKEDMVFRPNLMLTDRAKQLDGKRVRISGFMYSSSKFRGIKKFIMVKNVECKYGPGGRADCLMNVILDEGLSTYYREEAIAIEGVLTINPFNGPEGNTWSIYELACDKVEKYRPRR